MGGRILLMAAVAAALACVADAAAQEVRVASTDESLERGRSKVGPPVLQAAAIPADKPEPVLDGRLDDAAWDAAQVAGDFVQYEPESGVPATERTEARVLYGQEALWVAVRAFDSAPDSIVGQLTRRDEESYSDQVAVIIDSYFDRRTAFDFRVNPAGVKTDVYHFDDTSEDVGWDAVWDVATATDDLGWTAEFRIPYSQLRFRDAHRQTWGVNFFRQVARRQETDVWSPTDRSESALVSRFGELRGLVGLEPPRRLEVTPYTLARVRRQPGEAGDPFWEPTAFSSTVGADARYGLTSDLTLDVTINPDFGQVEADPAQVNLSAYETFFPERRPFFVEGSNLFAFSLAMGDGDDAVESLFYTRRIGRAPQGDVDLDGDGFTRAPDNTTILGAAKLSGKTATGWSIGVLGAVTGEESAEVAPEGADLREQVVEPRTGYGLARVQKDFREGRTALGVIGTVVARDRAAADALELRRDAVAGGVDFRHRFGDDAYVVDGYVLGSYVRGSAASIDRTQRSSAHWFQRPDAEHVEYDPGRTSMSGFSAQASLGRITGHWRWATGFQSRSPGFEVNDAGYMRESDFTSVFAYGGYDQSTPQGPFRRWRINLNAWNGFSWGMERYNSGGNVNGSFQLANFWWGYAGVNYNHGGLSNGLLRGGPAMRREPQWNGWSGLGTDERKPVRLNLNANWNVRPESDSWRVSVSPTVSWRPSGRASLGVGTFVTRNVDDLQWVDALEVGGEDRWVFGRIHQTTVGLTGRLDYAFSPTLSLQLYAQPYVSAGMYDEFKQVVDPRADGYADRLGLLAPALEDGTYEADLDGDGVAEAWDDPDFNFRQFRSNAVLRWEYRPGSTLYVVWSQGRNQYLEDGRFDFGRGMDGLFGAHPDDIFMLKLSYWINP
ncbi:MAG: DUF5916 domain-containing protein [Gemmatimonadota bacterium]|jgi:hypothetical protein